MIRAIIALLRSWFALPTATQPGDDESHLASVEEPQQAVPDLTSDTDEKPEPAENAGGAAGGSDGEAQATGTVGAMPPPVAPAHALIDASWMFWHARAASWLERPAESLRPVHYEDVLYAALGLGAPSLFPADLDRMTLEDWNGTAVAWLKAQAASEGGWRLPRWPIFAAMGLLGFDPKAFRSLAGDNLLSADDDKRIVDLLIDKGAKHGPGILVVEAAPKLVDLNASRGPDPLLAIPAESFPTIWAPLEPIVKSGAFKGIVIEESQAAVLQNVRIPAKVMKVKINRSASGEAYKPEMVSSLFNRVTLE